MVTLPKLLWLDLETTGLSLNDHCLEVGMVATDSKLDVLGATSFVLYFAGEANLLDPYVLEMHTKNGLLAQCKRTDWFINEVDQELTGFVKTHWLDPLDRAILAGRNIGSFDKIRLERWFPQTHALCHYRTFDMTTLYLYEEAQYPKGPTLHRSLPDIYSDLLELRHRLTKGASVIGG